jgi:aryl-alcohol dehydrogenase-like predicted oxidoreductase
MQPGFATPEGTRNYTLRFERNHDFYRTAQGLSVSSLGIGTYLGGMDEAASLAYIESIKRALRGGINFVDTSLNYRHMRSELAIGAALDELLATREVRREEVVVCTKAGFLVPNALPDGVLHPGDVVGGMHSMAPAFLQDQLERSRINLGLETIDVFYLHNPETQLSEIAPEEFYSRIRGAFELLEGLAAIGQIRYYGAATWSGFRTGQLSLKRLHDVASEVAGEAHRFRWIQLPFNAAMPEAGRDPVQDGKTVFEAARNLGIAVVGSASILQGRLARTPEQTAEALRFARSGVAVALVGMGNPVHVEQNLAHAVA